MHLHYTVCLQLNTVNDIANKHRDVAHADKQRRGHKSKKPTTSCKQLVAGINNVPTLGVGLSRKTTSNEITWIFYGLFRWILNLVRLLW